MKQRNRVFLWTSVALIGCGIALFIWKQSPPSSVRTDSVKGKSPSIAPMTTLVQSALPSISPRFSKMSPQERDLILDKIKRQDSLTIYHTWIECGGADSDLMKQGTIGTILWGALRYKGPNGEVYKEMSKFIADGSNSTLDRAQLIGILSQAKTKDALAILLQVAAMLQEKDLQTIAFRSIGAAGEIWGDGTFHEELSPALERAWRETQNPNLLASVAVAMAKVGAPSGVDLLISSALASGFQDEIRANAAREALGEMLNSSAVPVLSARLSNETPTDTASVLASSTLVAIGDEIAAKALLNWLQNANESVAQLAHDYTIQTRTPAQLEAWELALNPAVPFRSEKNREAIRTGLAEFHKSRKSE
jgi:hypothetical protein